MSNTDDIQIHRANEQLTPTQACSELQAARRDQENQADSEAKAKVADRLQLGRDRVEAAYAAEGSEELIAEGRWKGFTRGDAIAWCWNLFQFEPSGFVHPGSQIRVEAMLELESGGIPVVFRYPERARELVENGLDPWSYRLHREALGSPTFDPSDVR